MTTVLHISASPRGAASDSGALAAAFLESYQDARPGTVVKTLDLWDGSLPQFGPAGASAKLAVFAGGAPEGEQAEVWAQAQALTDQFTSADAYVFSIPMWNAGVPYVFKQWVDIITQRGTVFGFDPAAGYSGLVNGKKAATIYTSGVYSEGVPIQFGADFHSTYVKDWLRFVGVTDVTEVRFQPTILTGTRNQDRDAALVAARDAGNAF
ncbi:NAD(P)H-dependent oxidoreductase [Amycolatopsis carbonis]|uniref:FMN dependent NADH:quinone oxidoreductase n=1 Tax=Amycolatopsis carbonis TaxID=715471 RepID=A0A9Y2IMT0_9PSEU|nr:NAD(P)H-dependent oxidoreductase [Amycolatopsis sp. 2-15]WIX82234.1 NAD(P)H-dependent oxidoreductase [Amycolatopsis sp. 2-15]